MKFFFFLKMQRWPSSNRMLLFTIPLKSVPTLSRLENVTTHLKEYLRAFSWEILCFIHWQRPPEPCLKFLYFLKFFYQRCQISKILSQLSNNIRNKYFLMGIILLCITLTIRFLMYNILQPKVLVDFLSLVIFISNHFTKW